MILVAQASGLCSTGWKACATINFIAQARPLTEAGFFYFLYPEMI
jgi:hypothetical protein